MFFVSGDPRPWYADPHLPLGILSLVAYFAAVPVYRWWDRRKQRIALEWPSVEGCVQVVIVASDITDSSKYAASLAYSYFVEEYQSGSYTRVFSSEEDADNFARQMKDRKIPIHYNPQKPDDSVLGDEDVEEFARQTPLLG
jgi:hypothetical protein